MNSVTYAIVACLRLRSKSFVMAMTAGKKLTARVALLFIQFQRNVVINTYRSAMVPEVVFTLLLTVVSPSFTVVYTVDYGAQAAVAVMVVTIPLVVLVLIFQRGVVSGLAAGTVEG